MVQQVQRTPTFAQKLAGGVSNLASNAAQGFTQVYNERAEDEALKKKGIDLTGISDPNTRSMMIADSLRKGENKQAGLGSIPSEFTEGGKQPENMSGSKELDNRIKTEQEIRQEAASETRRKIEQGIDTDYDTEVANLQRTKQGQLGDRAIKESFHQESDSQLMKALGNKYTPEIGAVFAREAEKIGLQNLDPSLQKSAIAKQVTRFSNDLSNMKSHIKKNKMTNYLTADPKISENRLTEVKSQVKPFLDKGLYDEARATLADKNYYPEEIEEVVSGLGETAKKELINFPSFTTESNKKELSPWDVESAPWEKFKLGPQETEKFVESLSNILQKDPSTNLVLLRKAYEDKGVDWDTFRSAIDELELTGQFNPKEDSQINQIQSTLKEPPLGYLGRLLHAVKLGGR